MLAAIGPSSYSIIDITEVIPECNKPTKFNKNM